MYEESAAALWEEGEGADSLVERISGGDRAAEAALVRSHRPKVLAMLQRLTGDNARAEDLTHETLIIVIEKLRREPILDAGLLTSYIMNTAKFHFLGWKRRRGNQLALMQDCDSLLQADDNGESQCLREEVSHSMRDAITRLTVPRDREILTRFYFCGQSKNEICHALDISPRHFDRIISRARGRLRSIVSAQEHAFV